jgi:hypothetical protein
MNLARVKGGSVILRVQAKEYEVWNKLHAALQTGRLKTLDVDPMLHEMYVLNTAETAGKATPSTPIYRIALQDAAPYTYIYLFNVKNQRLPSAMNRSMLTSLKQRLV